MQQPPTHSMDLEFHGKAAEYFRIWIVNIVLTILTLGIYSAWAKVRNKQYFYSNTLLDGSAFEYTANPVAILKGRLVVASVLIIYYISIHFYPISEGFFSLLFVLALPWLIMRGLMFNARYSSYRNLNFSFQKSLAESIKTFIGIGILMVLTLGLLYPYYMYAIQQYRVSHHQFGLLNFHLRPVAKSFYKFYLVAGLMLLGTILLVFAIYSATLGPVIGLLGSNPEQTQNPQLPTSFMTIIFTMLGVYLFFYLMVFAYIRAKTFNTVWSNTELHKQPTNKLLARGIIVVRFIADVSARRLFSLYLTNTLAIIASAGLMIPWAKIRLARYRIEHLDVAAITDLDIIVAKERESVGTIGSEMGDILDIDIGI